MKPAKLQPNKQQNLPPVQKQPELLSDAELLGKLLFPGTTQPSGFQLAESLLQRFGGLRGLQIASRLTTCERKGLDDQAAFQIRLASELVRRQLKQSLQR
ncbi:MAG: hypothetical protein GY732_21150, partial [Gammaproteobacteria bacterium]|nr:hypothetical protein [Gammaproteobacteria bacterium]